MNAALLLICYLQTGEKLKIYFSFFNDDFVKLMRSLLNIIFLDSHALQFVTEFVTRQ